MLLLLTIAGKDLSAQAPLDNLTKKIQGSTTLPTALWQNPGLLVLTKQPRGRGYPFPGRQCDVVLYLCNPNSTYNAETPQPQ